MSGTVPGATFFIMSSVIIKGNPGTINQIYYLLNKGINNTAINLDNAFSTLNRRRKDICKYKELMYLAGSPDDPGFQKRYCGFYRVRRDAKWRFEYFHLMASFQNRGDASFGEILLRLFQATGRIESSFTSKMLATLAPDMPIWDSKVLKALHLQLKGSTPELRISNAVILYNRICHWYKLFLNTEQAESDSSASSRIIRTASKNRRRIQRNSHFTASAMDS